MQFIKYQILQNVMVIKKHKDCGTCRTKNCSRITACELFVELKVSRGKVKPRFAFHLHDREREREKFKAKIHCAKFCVGYFA